MNVGVLRELGVVWVKLFTLNVVLSVPLALAGGWVLMLATALIHALWIHAVPTVGFWTSAALVYLVRILGMLLFTKAQINFTN